MGPRGAWRLSIAATVVALATTSLHSKQSEADALRRSKAVYAALTSYADTGTVVGDYGAFSSHAAFKTYFRRKGTVDLYFDYTLQYDLYTQHSDRLNYSNSRRLWWMRNRNLQTYNFETKEHRTYPATADQAGALNEPRTKGASLLITELLFRSANLPGTILQIEESSDAGMEDVDGHACHKIVGVAAQYYPSGQRTGIRQVTVWIDRDTLLIRKVFEDTPKKSAPDVISRFTFRLDPQANPVLDDSKFDVQIPGIQ